MIKLVRVKMNAPVMTERLVLEPIAAAHAALLFAPMQDERIYRWLSIVPPRTVESLRTRWAELASRVPFNGGDAFLNWAIRRTSDGKYVGKFDAVVNLTNVATNVGYLLFPEFWGQGYGTEATRGIVAHLTQLSVTEFRALVTSGNDASVRVLVKAGFVRTRTIPDNDTIRGVKYDDIEYVLRSSE